MTFKLPADFQPITLQRVFDAAWKKFIVEKGEPAYEISPRSSGCAYLTPDGRKCAIGLLIPDGHPAQRARVWVSSLYEIHPELFPSERFDDRLRSAQMALHDSHTGFSLGRVTWDSSLEDRRTIYLAFAKQHQLTVPS